MISLALFFQFMKYGLLCFGGGYMIIPLLYTDLVQKTPVFTPENYGNLLSISQMTPGPVSINTATYVGFIQDGLTGALSATFGLCLPTFILALSVLTLLNKKKDSPLVVGFFKGIKWAALIMILSAIILFAKISILDVSQGIFHINKWEILMTVITLLLANKVPFTLLLFLSAFIGWGISYL